ncbi:hypothetical protein Tco_1474343 [Tanacetum coccineum]
MVFHNEDGNPARANIKQALGYLKDGDGDGNSQHLRYQDVDPPEGGRNGRKSIFGDNKNADEMMPPPDPNNSYIKPPSKIQILKFIKTHGYDEDPETKMTMLWGIVRSANLDFALLIWDEFKWQAVERSSGPSKMSKLLYTRFTKLIINRFLSNNKSDYKFGMEIPNSMTIDAINKSVGYNYYMAKKKESAKDKIIDEPEEKHVSLVKNRRGKGFMCYRDHMNLQNPSIFKNRKRRRSQLKIDRQTDEAVADMYNEWGQKLKGPAVEVPAVQSLLDLWKGSKASRLKSLRQKKQLVIGEGSSVAFNKYYDSSYNDSEATLYSLSSDTIKESANETDDADESDMDLSDDNPNEDDDAARYGVFMHNKSIATPNSTYLSPTATSSSLDYIQTLLDETRANELTDFMSHPVYTDTQTTLVVHNPEGNPELTSYILGASEVPLVTHVDVLATKTLLQEMFSTRMLIIYHLY